MEVTTTKDCKTTTAKYELFVAECRRLLKKFNIDTWQIYFELRKLDGSQAQIITDTVLRVATISLNTSTSLHTDEMIKGTALHEICHLLISEISDLATMRYVSSNDVVQACESVTRKLENLLRDKQDE
jgi:hypothetical protein